MAAMPKKMIFGVALGLLGGIIALAAMFVAWDGTLDSMTLVGLNMLVTVMFFAVAGTFTRHVPVPGNTVLVLATVCEAAVVVSVLYEATYFWLNLILLVIGAANILIAACPAVTKWVDAERI